MLTVIRDPELFSSPVTIFQRYVNNLWSEPRAGSGLVFLFPTQMLLEYWEEKLLEHLGSFGGARFLLFDGLVREVWQETRPDWGQVSGEAGTLILRRIFLNLKAEGQLSYYSRALDSFGFFSSLREEIAALKRGGITAERFAEWAAEGPGGGARPANRDFSLIYREYQNFLHRNRLADAEERITLTTVDLEISSWIKSLRRLLVIGFPNFTGQQEAFLTKLAKITPVTLLFDSSADGCSGVFSPGLTNGLVRSSDQISGSVSARSSPDRRQVIDIRGSNSTLQLSRRAGKKETNLAYLQKNLWRNGVNPGSRVVLTGPAPLPEENSASASHPAPDGTVRLLKAEGGWRREMKAVALEVRELLWRNPGLSPDEIGVITPYIANLREIYEIFRSVGLSPAGRVRETIRFQPAARALLQPFITVAKEYCWEEMVKLLRWTGLLPGEKMYSKVPKDLTGWRLWLKELFPKANTGFLFAYLESIPPSAPLTEYLEIAGRWLNEPVVLKGFLPAGGGDDGFLKVRFVRSSVIASLHEIIAELAEIGEVFPEWEMSLEEFIALLEGVLSAGTQSIPHGWGGGIRLFTPQEARGLRFAVTLITGLNEGLFPAVSSSGWVMGEKELAHWRKKGFPLPSMAEELSMERLAFHNALHSAADALILSCCETDEAGQPLNPSSFWEDIRSLLPEVQVKRPVRGFDPTYFVLPPMTGKEEDVDCKIRAERGRRIGVPSYNGILGEAERRALEKDFTATPLSVTALEEYAGCPFAFYCGRLLRITALEEPALIPDRIEEGSIYHQALKDFFRRHRGEALVAGEYSSYLNEMRKLIDKYYPRPPDNSPPMLTHLIDLGRETIFTRLSRLVREEIVWQEKTGGCYTPLYLELGFGGSAPDGDEDFTEKVFSLQGDGFRLDLRGKIDRVDAAPEGGFIIYDYKLSGRAKRKEVKDGKLLQLPLYLQAMRAFLPELGEPQGMTYYNLTRTERKDGFWRAGFAGRFGLKLKETREEEWEELLAQSRARALEYFQGIISGKYPLLPPVKKCPAYCRFKRVCRRAVSGGTVDESGVE